MEKKKSSIAARRRPHCVVLAYPAQGHINPMIQFSKHLVQEGVRVTVATTRFQCKRLHKVPPSMSLESISDGFDSGRGSDVSIKAYLERFGQVGPQTLSELLDKLDKTESPADCIIYDSFLSWTLDVANQFGIVAAAYLTQNMAVNSIYYHAQLGKLKFPLPLISTHDEDENEISLPAMPTLQYRDLPSFFFTYEQDPVSFHLLVDQFSNIHKAHWILCNVFSELDTQVADWTRKTWPKFRSIGPNIPSRFLDKRLKDDEDYGATQFESSDEECMEWLDSKPKGSVIYVSFGSLVPLDEEQIVQVAYALRDISTSDRYSYYFLWVVRASEETKLPKDFAKKSEKGLVVTWCSQLKVLDHEAVGCFVTHCGWNSTLETLSLGVPTVAVPQWSDQSTNAKYMEQVWKVGIRAPVDEKMIVRGEALKDCIREVMDKSSEKGREMKKNAIHWKTLAKGAVSEGGSSHSNIMEFVNSLYHASTTCMP